MKHFTFPNPIFKFPVKCPRDNKPHQAIIRVFYPKRETAEILDVQCHGSYECVTCRQCLSCLALIFHFDESPDFFEAPLDPKLSSRWKDAAENPPSD